MGSVDNYKTLVEAIKIAQKPMKIVCIKLNPADTLPAGALDFQELIDPKSADFSTLTVHDINPNDCVFLPFSSGTTGMPKGVMLTHNNISANSEMIHVPTGINDSDKQPVVLETTSSFQEVLPCVLPFFHIYGWTATLVSKLGIGSKIITLPQFRPDTFLNVLEKEKATVLHLVPPIGKYSYTLLFSMI